MEIPGYKIEEELGVGGMATVYLAVQENLHRHVALKIMTPGLSVDETYCKRFVKEGRIAAQLNHANLLTVYDTGVYDSHYYMATEYLPGGTVRQKMNAGITVNEIVRVIIDIGNGLQFAHDKGFVHRDVKPGNFMFRGNGDCVLGDFGIAKAVNSNTGSTKLGTSIGTPHYMSPEQAKGEKVDNRSDLYSLGVVFFELLSGKPPFDADDPFSIALMQISDPTPPLPNEHRRFEPLIQRLMAKNRDQRYRQADDFIEDLEVVMADLKATRNQQPKYGAPGSNKLTAPSAQLESGSKSMLIKIAMHVSISVLLVAALYVGWTKFSNRSSTDPDVIASPNFASTTGAGANGSIKATDPVSEQMARARSLIDAGKLLHPRGDNALEVYNALLKGDPDNQAVLRAKLNLAAILMQNAQTAWLAGNLAQAGKILQRAIEEFPKDQGLRLLQQQVLEPKAVALQQTDSVTDELDRDPKTASLDSVNQSEIDELLTRGDRFYEANIFSHPPGENATDMYLQVIAMQADNQRAVSRLDQIAGTWANAAAANLKRGKLGIAKRMVGKGLQASPNNVQLLSLKKRIANQGS